MVRDLSFKKDAEVKTRQTTRPNAKHPDSVTCSSSSSAPPANEIERIQSFNDLARELKSEQSFKEKLRHATARGKVLTSADLTFVCLADKRGSNHRTRASAGDTELNETELDFSIEENPGLISMPGSDNTCTQFDMSVQHPGIPVVSERLDEIGIRFCIVVPLRVKNGHLGFLFAGNRNPAKFTLIDQCLLSLIGNLLAAEIGRKRSEEDHERLATVLEQAAETIMITNREGVIQYVNPSFEAISGYTREETVGKRPDFLRSGHHDADFYKEMWGTLRAGDIWRGNLVNRQKDGSLYELDATITPIKNDRGEITDYVSVRKDITQESLLRKQLYQAQKMEAIGTLAGGIAHDFNNLLMGIQGNVSLMRMDIPSDSNMQERCQIVEDYIHKGADLTRQLLGVARGGKYQQVPTDISKLVNTNLKMFGRTKKEIQTHMLADSRPCDAEVDPGQIDQVFLNLFVNAWQAMPDGGHLYVETELVSINARRPGIANLKPGTYVKASIRDTGTGIPGAIIDKIFDPFFTTKEKGRGTGLGLASAYGIIKNHGGIIQVSSEVNEGTSFEIFLPESDKSSVEKNSCAIGHFAEGRETVLIVDDEAPVLEICGEMLKRLGYNVITADKGTDALIQFEAGKDDIDLVVLDLIMPGMRGEEVYDHLVDLKPNIRVLLASGYALEKQVWKFPSSNAVGFIQKPYSVTDLSEKVRQLLSEG